MGCGLEPVERPQKSPWWIAALEATNDPSCKAPPACVNACLQESLFVTQIFSLTLTVALAPALASGFVPTVWIIVFLGGLNPRFDGQTRPAKLQERGPALCSRQPLSSWILRSIGSCGLR